MALGSISERIRPTKGFLIELKRRIGFIERGCELLKMKRDQLSKELREGLDELRVRRRALEDKLESAYDTLTAAYMTLGSFEVESQAASVEKNLSIDVLPKGIMGVPVPFLKLQVAPSVEGKSGSVVYGPALEFKMLLEDLFRSAEFEAKIERIAYELGRTNRMVNSLEKIVIPSYRQIAKYIEGRLEEDMLEEFIKTKLIKGVLERRRK